MVDEIRASKNGRSEVKTLRGLLCSTFVDHDVKYLLESSESQEMDKELDITERGEGGKYLQQNCISKEAFEKEGTHTGQGRTLWMTTENGGGANNTRNGTYFSVEGCLIGTEAPDTGHNCAHCGPAVTFFCLFHA